MSLKKFVQDFNNFELLDRENQFEMIRLSLVELNGATIKQVYAHLRKVAGVHPQGVVEDVIAKMVNNRELKMMENGQFICINN